MNLEQIKREWYIRPSDYVAEAAMWDGTADEYVYEAKNSFEEDPFLQFVARKVELTPGMRVLDVGCGAGAFCVAMAGRVGQADGVDLSGRMVELGNAYARDNGIGNVSLSVRNWHTCDGSEFKGAYNLVFAHTTPAIADYATLMKMVDASRKHCFICTTARRVDYIYDECRRIAGIETVSMDEHVAYLYDALWLSGYNPETEYAKMTWLPVKTVDEATSWFLGRLRSRGSITEGSEGRVREYIASLADGEGMVHERIETTLANFYWQK